MPCHARYFNFFFLNRTNLFCVHHRMRSNVDRGMHICTSFFAVSSVMRFQCYNQNENENKQLLQFMALHLLVLLCFFLFLLFFSSFKQMLCFRNFSLCFLIFFSSRQKQNGIHHCIAAMHLQCVMRSHFFGTHFVNVIRKCFYENC